MVVAVIVVFFSFLFLYAATLLILARGFSKMPGFEATGDVCTGVTVIVCARNEEKHLAKCLKGIAAQDFPKHLLQVVVVNDASTDSTALIADHELESSGIDHRILSNPQQKGKKRSITFAIRFAKHDLVVLRDADTYVESTHWLRDVVLAWQRSHSLVIGPVVIAGGTGVLAALQGFESSVLNIVTGGSAFLKKPFLCSGANLAFSKSLFEQAGGFSSHEHLVSGDDVFFLEAVKKLGAPVRYLKSRDAVVFTPPLGTPREIIAQKARWASKFRYNSNLLNLWLAFLVFAANMLFIFAVAGLLLKPEYRAVCGVYIVLKMLSDVTLLYIASRYMKVAPAFLQLIPVSVLYPVYAVIVAFISMFTQPAWKEE